MTGKHENLLEIRGVVIVEGDVNNLPRLKLRFILDLQHYCAERKGSVEEKCKVSGEEGWWRGREVFGHLLHVIRALRAQVVNPAG